MVVASLLLLLGFMLTREEASGVGGVEKRIFRPNIHTLATQDLGKVCPLASITLAATHNPLNSGMHKNEHVEAELKVGCHQPGCIFNFTRDLLLGE